MNRWLILFCAFLLFAGMVIGEDPRLVKELAAECSADNQEACIKLADFCMTKFSQEACKKLADIARIAGNNKDKARRNAAVEKLNNQTVLAKITLEDLSLGDIALKKLAAQAPRVKASTDDKDWRVRLILKFISAFDTVPTEHRERLMMEVLPAIRVLIYPKVVSETGDIVSIET